MTALDAGASWEVQFLPFSLAQAHVDEGKPDVWDVPDSDTGLLALRAGIVGRDRFPEQFHAAHRALFAQRHDHGGSLKDADALEKVLRDIGVDADAVFSEIHDGWPRATVKAEHTAWVSSHHVWGVPTFIVGDQAAFVRVMDRPGDDADLATRTIERILDLLDWPELNEFKHTAIPK